MTNWEKLLGGYATGTLTSEEREALMQAALHDQALFDALMDEESLRETLADPATRTALLLALEPPAKTTAWWRNPWPWAGLGAVGAAVALFIILRPSEPPKAVQMAQNRSAAAAPERVPVVIETPKQLAPSPVETDQLRMAVPRAKFPAEVHKTVTVRESFPLQPPPAAAPARQDAERSEMAGARLNAPSAAPAPAPAVAMTAKKKETADERLAEPLAVTLSYQAADGAWHPLDVQSAIPASRPLRLHVTSGQSGQLRFQPPLVEPRTLLAGIPAEVLLPAQPAGTLRLSLTLAQPQGQAFGRLSPLRQSESSENKARSMTAADSAVSPSTLIWTREIRLRIE